MEVKAEEEEATEKQKGLCPISPRSVSSPLSNVKESECILDEEEEKKNLQALIVPLSHFNHRLAVKIMLTYCASNWAIYLFARSGPVKPEEAAAVLVSPALGPATPVYHQVASFPFPSSLLEKEH